MPNKFVYIRSQANLMNEQAQKKTNLRKNNIVKNNKSAFKTKR